MLQIIGKGGFAKEISAYEPNSIMFENEGVEYLNLKTPVVIAIGDGTVRKKIAEKYPLLWYSTLELGKQYGDCSIGVGTIICPGTILTQHITIGNHVIINLNCTIGHDCTIGNYTTISPGVNVSGNCKIGANCYIGSNAVIREKITICSDVIIGAGSVVVKDITEPGTYVGNPVKKIR